MRVRYVCENCGATMAQFHISRLDEERLGLSRLTAEERLELVVTDHRTGDVTIRSLCEECTQDAGDSGSGGSGTVIH